MVRAKTGKRARSDELLAVLAPYERILIVMHDNPDPDAIASGWAIAHLIEEKLGKQASLLAGGTIARAENRHMVDLLGPPVQLVLAIDIPDRAATVLVDCGMGAGNQLLARDGFEPVAVVDHHPTSLQSAGIPFVDVRAKVAASASIATSYLIEQNIEPGSKLATALWYAVRTETHGSEFRYTPLDHEILVWLTARADPELLAEIESAPLAREYYADLVAALRDTVLYGDSAFCLLPRAAGPEIVGEIADLLVRCQGVRSVFCAAICDEDLIISVRTDIHGEDAAELLRKTLAGQGGCGGHEHRAGGKISHVGADPQAAAELCAQLKTRWLQMCGAEAGAAGVPLLAGAKPPEEV